MQGNGVIEILARESPAELGARVTPSQERDSVLEFLKSLQMLPSGTPSRVVDSSFRPLDVSRR